MTDSLGGSTPEPGQGDSAPLDPSKDLVHTTPVEIAVANFEGEMVRYMVGKVPGLTLDMDHGYKRNTHLKVELELRVRKVSTDEYTSGVRKGELYREHLFTVEEAKVIGAYTADELDPGVGGSAAAQGDDLAEEDFEGDTDGDVGF